MSKEVYRRLSKAERKLESINRLRTNNTTLRIKYEGIKKLLEKKDKETKRLKNVINELEKMIKNDLEFACSMNENGIFNGVIDMLEVYLNKLHELKGSDKQ